MTSVLAPPGKYRTRKDWSTNSIPQAVEEEVPTNNPSIIINNGFPMSAAAAMLNRSSGSIASSNGGSANNLDTLPPIPMPRKGSATATMMMSSSNGAINGLAGIPPKAPRRSSLAINLLTGRKDSDKSNKRRSSIAVAMFGRKDKNHANGVAEKNGKVKNDENDPSMALDVPEGYEKKRRRSSWQARLDRRKRKPATVDSNGVDIDMMTVPENGYNRQKRHSFWDIFALNNFKSR